MSRTLLVGATGFLGTHVAARLAERDPRLFVRPTSRRDEVPQQLETVEGDLSDGASLEAALRGVDALVYCASMGFGHVPGVIQACSQAKVRRAVFVSTTAIFTGLPATSRASRLAAEAAVIESGMAWTIVRPTMIYGTARDRNIARLLRVLHRTPIFPVFGSGQGLQQPIYVGDLADAVVAALAAPSAVGHAYNLGGAAPLPYASLIRTAAGALGRDVRLLQIPVGLALALAGAGAAIPGWRFPVTREQILRLGEDKVVDNSDAIRDLGVTPRSFAEGVKLEAAALGLAPVRVDGTSAHAPLVTGPDARLAKEADGHAGR